MKKIDLFKVFMAEDAAGRVKKVLNSGFIGQGPQVEEFESQLRSHFGTNVLTTNSCTSALQLAVHLVNEPGVSFGFDDEIITTPLTCFATVSAILNNGCRVRWADINPDDCNIDPEDVERKLNARTRAILVVHWGGYSVDLDRLRQVQLRYKEKYGRELPIIEDCAHCWDSKYKKQLVGTSGNHCCFSLQAIKFLTTSDGGVLIAPNNELHKRAKLLRWFGLDRDSGASFRCIQDIKENGGKHHLNDVAAAIGIANLPHIKTLVERHRENDKLYRKALSGMGGLELLQRGEDRESSCWLFTVRVKDRKEFIAHLERHGIAASPVHARCDGHSCVQEFRCDLPGMDALQDEMCCLPVGWWVSDEDREYVVDTIRKGW